MCDWFCVCMLVENMLFPCTGGASPYIGPGSSNPFSGEDSRGQQTKRSGKGRGKGRKSVGARIK